MIPRKPARQVTLTGQLFGPNGTTPISGATVTVDGASASAAQFAPNQLPNPQCEEPAGGVPYTCTEADGTFELTTVLTGSTANLRAVKGTWSVSFSVTLGSTAGNAGTVTLPSNPSAGAPRMAVVLGEYDDIGAILYNLGFTGTDYYTGSTYFWEFPEGGTGPYVTPKSIFDLFEIDDATGKPVLFQYSIVFFNCGWSDYDNFYLPDNLNIIREYVAGGGRIYVSDLAYDVIEQAFPNYINFAGDDSTRDEAQVGPAIPDGLDVTVRDVDLAASLAARDCGANPCISEEGKVHIDGWLSNWALMEGNEPTDEGATVKFWVEGIIPGLGPTPYPLTATFPVEDGLVLFTSYHNEPGSGAGDYLPQKYILEYLVFSL